MDTLDREAAWNARQTLLYAVTGVNYNNADDRLDELSMLLYDSSMLLLLHIRNYTRVFTGTLGSGVRMPESPSDGLTSSERGKGGYDLIKLNTEDFVSVNSGEYEIVYDKNEIDFKIRVSLNHNLLLNTNMGLQNRLNIHN